MDDQRAAGKERLINMGLGYNMDAEGEVEARLVLVGWLDGLLGDSEPVTPLEFAKAAVIREAIGDNRNASNFAHMFGLKRSESALQFLSRRGWAERLEAIVRKNPALFPSKGR